jgi:hypothetical protein
VAFDPRTYYGAGDSRVELHLWDDYSVALDLVVVAVAALESRVDLLVFVQRAPSFFLRAACEEFPWVV